MSEDAVRRMRWRCRRGLLELDILLERFVAARYASLDAAQQAVFDELLDMPDTRLWDMVSGKQPPQQESHRIMLEWIKGS